MEEGRKIRVEITGRKGEVGESEREIRIEIPAGVEFSEEEIKKVVTATQNEIVDVIRGVQAKQLAAETVAKIGIVWHVSQIPEA
jgi:hypothetical protein